MLLFLEFALTVVAWQKGWRGFALLPGAIGMVVALLIGIWAGLNGVAENQVLPFFFLVDFGIVGCLFMMCRRNARTFSASLPEAPVSIPQGSETIGACK